MSFIRSLEKLFCIAAFEKLFLAKPRRREDFSTHFATLPLAKPSLRDLAKHNLRIFQKFQILLGRVVLKRIAFMPLFADKREASSDKVFVRGKKCIAVNINVNKRKMEFVGPV